MADNDPAKLGPVLGDVGGRVVEGRLRSRIDRRAARRLALRPAALRRAAPGVDLLQALLADRRRDVGGVGAERDQLGLPAEVAGPRGAEDALGELPLEALRAAAEPVGERGGEELGEPGLVDARRPPVPRRRPRRASRPGGSRPSRTDAPSRGRARSRATPAPAARPRSARGVGRVVRAVGVGQMADGPRLASGQRPGRPPRRPAGRPRRAGRPCVGCSAVAAAESPWARANSASAAR